MTKIILVLVVLFLGVASNSWAQTATNTATSTPTSTPTATGTSTPTFTPTSTATNTATNTLIPTRTPTSTLTSTKTYTPTLTYTSTFTYTPTPTPSSTRTSTPTYTPLPDRPGPASENTLYNGLIGANGLPYLAGGVRATPTPYPAGTNTATPTSTPTPLNVKNGLAVATVVWVVTPNANTYVTLGGVYDSFNYFYQSNGLGGTVTFFFKTYMPGQGTTFNNSNTGQIIGVGAASGSIQNAPASIFTLQSGTAITPTPGGSVTLIVSAYLQSVWKNPGFWIVELNGKPFKVKAATIWDRLWKGVIFG